jgi:hypothetical protein
MFRKFSLSLSLSFGLLAFAAIPLANSADAAFGEGVIGGLVQLQPLIEETAYVYGGYSYCWCDEG